MPSTLDDPIFVLSPRYSRELEGALGAAGVAATYLRRAGDVAQAFGEQPGRLALVDARGTLVAGLGAARELADVIEARQGALLVLLSKSDGDAFGAVYATGATHVLVSPFSDATLIDKLRFAVRMIDRLSAAAAGQVAPLGRDGARRDALTGLATATHALGWVDLLLTAEAADDSAIIVMVVAIGRFAQINAAYGRTVADALLQAVAIRLRRAADAQRDYDAGDSRLVARLAGAEFALVLAGPVTLPDAMRFAQRIADSFEAPFAVGGRVVHLACRVGIAAADTELRDVPHGGAETLFRQASAALVSARAREPGSIEVFQSAPGADPLTRMADLESDLRRAVEADEFEILFQPQVELSRARIVGVEALVRWQHPRLGQLSAETLLEVAESAEFATQLGDHIRGLAIRAAALWPPQLDHLQLSVNVTAADLSAPGFAAGLLELVAEAGFPARRLTLEVTEGDLIEDLESAVRLLGGLRRQGIQVSLDDFGTGYSSLAYLKDLPLDNLKVDKRLIADLGGTARDRVVVKSIVDMALALGMCVVAEGVETEEQRAAVEAYGCNWYQGFLCAPPLTSAALVAHVATWNAVREAAVA